ncbi:hypothetical protein [Polaribacter haliotis]|uniref:hypothetical protein n=1 Tax=Polaribacter haliotis TaxID=1888915 RepID=UPI001E49EE6F|nr:hypothetical protein [Polaribacter haliotis]
MLRSRCSNFTNRVLQNVGDLQVNGVEFTLNADVIKTEDIDWSINFNATYLDREIKKTSIKSRYYNRWNCWRTGNFIQLFSEGLLQTLFMYTNNYTIMQETN